MSKTVCEKAEFRIRVFGLDPDSNISNIVFFRVNINDSDLSGRIWFQYFSCGKDPDPVNPVVFEENYMNIDVTLTHKNDIE